MNISDKEYDKYIRFYLDTLFESDKNNYEAPQNNIYEDMLSYIRKYAEQTLGEKNYLLSYPLSAQWNVTSACNFRCAHCMYNDRGYYSSNDLSTEQASNLADELIEAGIVFVQLSGGEAFLRNDLMDIVRKFKRNNVSVTILTNGSLLTDENINEIAELFNPYSLDTIQISLDAATDETFQKIRGCDKFNKINENIKKLVAKGVNVNCVCTLNSINKDEIIDICRLAKILGVKFFIGKVLVFNDSHNNLTLSNRELFKIYYDLIYNKLISRSKLIKVMETDKILNIAEVQKIIEEPHYQECLTKLPTNAFDFDCQYHDRIAIQSDGRMFFCKEALNYDFEPIGSYKENSFEEIWQKRFEHALYKPRNIKKSSCRRCKYNIFCGGGCKLEAYINSGDVNAPSIPNCKACN